MSLIDNMMEPCVIMDKVTKRDPAGGKITAYVDGAEIRAAITCDTSLEARIAGADGVKDVYTITTRRSDALAKPDVIKRVRDGAIFRITSDGNEKTSPDISTLDMAQASAESWVLPK
jgi:head-tail adaptor